MHTKNMDDQSASQIKKCHKPKEHVKEMDPKYVAIMTLFDRVSQLLVLQNNNLETLDNKVNILTSRRLKRE